MLSHNTAKTKPWQSESDYKLIKYLLNTCKDILKYDGGAYDLQPYQSKRVMNAIKRAEKWF